MNQSDLHNLVGHNRHLPRHQHYSAGVGHHDLSMRLHARHPRLLGQEVQLQLWHLRRWYYLVLFVSGDLRLDLVDTFWNSFVQEVTRIS